MDVLGLCIPQPEAHIFFYPAIGLIVYKHININDPNAWFKSYFFDNAGKTIQHSIE